ncbi:MAG: xanthine dehydrogenase family protein subunit M [Anaerolineae bacterium]|nr:xanthine dehydrogenase family protein subunit M [Anaerolineae bacterium]
MKPVPFNYFAPTSVEEALDKLAELGYDGKILAGGQSLVPAMNFRMARPGALVDLNNIPELAYIKPTSEGGLAIGTMTRDSKVEHDPKVIEMFPLLGEVMPNIAHAQIRNRGTFGGSIAHADPAGQLPAISIALDANLFIQSKSKERWVKATDFFTGPFMTVLDPDDMLVEIVLPPHLPHTGSSYQQVSRQRGGYAQAAVASVVTLDDQNRCKEARVVLISVGDTPILSARAKEILVGQKPTAEAFKEVAQAIAANEIDPATDIHATADYRRHLVEVLVERSLTIAFDRAKKGV